MKKRLLLPAVLMTVTCLAGQGDKERLLELHQAQMSAIEHSGASAAKNSSAIHARLVKKIGYLHDGISAFYKGDSMTYAYTGGRGYDAAEQTWQFDNGTTVTCNKTTCSNLSKRDNIYDSKNNLTESTLYNWDNGKWVLGDRSTITYNPNTNQKTETLFQGWDGTKWVNVSRTTYKYNSTGQQTEIYQETWDNGKWIGDQRTAIKYTAGIPVEYVQERAVMGVFSNLLKITYTYSGGKCTQYASYLWDDMASNWTADSKTTYTYNTKGQKTLEEYFNWDATTSVWNKTSKGTYTYDATGSSVEAEVIKLYPAYEPQERRYWKYNLDGQVAMDGRERWNAGTNSYKYQNCDPENYYFYEDYFPTALTDLDATGTSLLLYPNPATRQMQVEISFAKPVQLIVSVADITGRILKQWKEAPTRRYHNVLDISDLPAGPYMLHINSELGTETKGFIKSE